VRRSTSGSSSALQQPRGTHVKLDVSARSGSTPSLTVTIEESPNGSTSWRTVATFPAFTNVGSAVRRYERSEPYIRASWAISGSTPSFTFGLTIGDDPSRV
jgi:hypothetical protein